MTSMFEQAHAVDPQAAAEKFNAGETIIGHVSNSPLDHPLIHLPKIWGIDFSVTKHVFMLWVVAAIVFLTVTFLVRRYLRQARLVPTGTMGVLEIAVEFIRDGIARPNVGSKWVNTWTPLLLTFFLFILVANLIGIIPIFDVLALANHYFVHASPDSFFGRVLHGGTTITGNFNVTAALATITFFTIIIAGTRAHGFVKHWVNLVPHGQPWPLYILLIPLETIGMFVRPFALTMRLAANMTGGHIAILAITSFVFIFAEMAVGSFVGASGGGILTGLLFTTPISAGMLGLELIVILVQAYVFTLLSAVFIGMAIHAHH
ncbi:MAG TPA: F0F1 ATP synthase subunit A [Vicinamibacterales bacterium]|nr:F0F1 ATP synthase subunit A [Vicinamibacterales bacterium]